MKGAYPVLVSSMNQDRPPTADELALITARIGREIGSCRDNIRADRSIGSRPTALAIASALIGLRSGSGSFSPS